MLNVIYIEAANGNALSIVVGCGETVLGFSYGHGNPPYYESRGPAVDDEPVLTGYVSYKHHTEFPRRCVIPVDWDHRCERIRPVRPPAHVCRVGQNVVAAAVGYPRLCFCRSRRRSGRSLGVVAPVRMCSSAHVP